MVCTIENILRPCYVNGEKALFHKWIEKDKLLFKAKSGFSANLDDIDKAASYYYKHNTLPNFVDVEKVTTTLAIIEYESGEVAEVEPKSIQFNDNKIKEYNFTEENNNV